MVQPVCGATACRTMNAPQQLFWESTAKDIGTHNFMPQLKNLWGIVWDVWDNINIEVQEEKQKCWEKK